MIKKCVRLVAALALAATLTGCSAGHARHDPPEDRERDRFESVPLDVWRAFGL